MKLDRAFLVVLVLVVSVYVDGILIGCEPATLLDKLKNYLANTFKLKDLRPLKYFLCLEITWLAKGIVLN